MAVGYREREKVEKSVDKHKYKSEIRTMAKRLTPIEAANKKLQDRLVKYYKKRQADGGRVQETMAGEVPCAVGTMNALLQYQRPLRGMTAIAISNYLDRMEA